MINQAPITRSGSYLDRLYGLAGKTALVIGGGGVLGGAIGRGLGLAGARVAVADYSEPAAVRAAAELAGAGIKAVGLAMDASHAEAIRAGLDRIEGELGEVDVLVNAAGGNQKGATVAPDQDFFRLPPEALKGVVELNLFTGAVLPCQIVGERMAGRARSASIINISSLAALRPLTRVVGYSAAKAAVSNFTQWLAVYMARDLKAPVRVNALAPGFMLTEQNRFLLTTDGTTLSPRGAAVIAQTPMARFGQSDDLIGAAIWLAGDASAFVTGIVLPIDGGFSAFAGV
ncbi:MAG: SDR family oxidoreductase [bacterium]|nr:SDR family oxidoreductase [bacterium]